VFSYSFFLLFIHQVLAYIASQYNRNQGIQHLPDNNAKGIVKQNWRVMATVVTHYWNF